MTPAEMNKTCEQVAPLLVFYACGETEPDEAAFVEQHLANCAACRAQLSEELIEVPECLIDSPCGEHYPSDQ